MKQQRARRALYWVPFVLVLGASVAGGLTAGAAPSRGGDTLVDQADALGCQQDELVGIETIDYIEGATGWQSPRDALRGARSGRVIDIREDEPRVISTAHNRVTWLATNGSGRRVAITATMGHDWRVTNLVACHPMLRPEVEG